MVSKRKWCRDLCIEALRELLKECIIKGTCCCCLILVIFVILVIVYLSLSINGTIEIDWTDDWGSNANTTKMT